ncbi:MAG: metallophosphoesterase family protein [Micromonosporaceae bacterium]
MTSSTLWAISDLHVAYQENRDLVERLEPQSAHDWLIVAGDVGERFADIEWALRALRGRFAKVIWAPGNHELWTPKKDPVQLRGLARYQKLVELCKSWDVCTPEDDYPIWRGAGGPAVVAPLFLLYDYSFRPPGVRTKEEALELAYQTGIVCTDEFLLHPDPYPSRDAWCRDRVALTERRLASCDPDLPTVLVNHFPLTREPTRLLRYPVFAQWCGTELTADWHIRFRASVIVYGHLHIPRTTWQDGVRCEEVSVGYPREWKPRSAPPQLRQVLPRPEDDVTSSGGFRF